MQGTTDRSLPPSQPTDNMGLVRRRDPLYSAYCLFQTLKPASKLTYQQFSRSSNRDLLKWCVSRLEELEKAGEQHQKSLNQLQRNLETTKAPTNFSLVQDAGSLWQLDTLLQRINEDFDGAAPAPTLRHQLSYEQLIKNIDNLSTVDTEVNSQPMLSHSSTNIKLEQLDISESSLNVAGRYQPSSIRAKVVLGLAGRASEALDRVVDSIAGGLLRRFLS